MDAVSGGGVLVTMEPSANGKDESFEVAVNGTLVYSRLQALSTGAAKG